MIEKMPTRCVTCRKEFPWEEGHGSLRDFCSRRCLSLWKDGTFMERLQILLRTGPWAEPDPEDED